MLPESRTRLSINELVALQQTSGVSSPYQVLGLPEFETLPPVVMRAYSQRIAEIEATRAAIPVAVIRDLLRICADAKLAILSDTPPTPLANPLSSPPPSSARARASQDAFPRQNQVAIGVAVAACLLPLLVFAIWKIAVHSPAPAVEPAPADAAIADKQRSHPSAPPMPPGPPGPPGPPHREPANLAAGKPGEVGLATGTQASGSPNSSAVVAGSTPSNAEFPLPLEPRPGTSPGQASAAAARSFLDDQARASKEIERAIELPDLEKYAAGKILILASPAGKDAKLQMDTSAADIREGYLMSLVSLENATKPTWHVRLERVSPAAQGKPSVFAQAGPEGAIRLASFILADDALHFEWFHAAPKKDACQLANCRLTLACGGRRYRCPLRKPIETPLVEIDLTDSPQKISLGIAPLPRAECLSLHVAPRRGFAESVTTDPPDALVAVNERLRLLPQATWRAEFHFELVPLSNEIALFHRPYFFLQEERRQDFTLKRLEAAVIATTSKFQRDSQRYAFLQGRLNSIPGQAASVRSAAMPAARRSTLLAQLNDEHKSAQSGLQRLSRTLPLTKSAGEALTNYLELAKTLHLQSQVEVRVVALADAGEIPLWIAK